MRVVRTYGSTETSGGCVYDGHPLRGVSVRIVDGEVQVAGPTLADGYLGDPTATDAVFRRDRRWHALVPHRRRRDHRGRRAAGARPHRQRHRLGRGQHLARPGRARRAGDPRPRVGGRGGRLRRPLGRGCRRGGRRAAKRCGAASRCSSKRRAPRSPTRSAPTRAPRAWCSWTTSRRCRAASPTARRSVRQSPRCTEPRPASGHRRNGRVSTTQNRLPSVSSRTT